MLVLFFILVVLLCMCLVCYIIGHVAYEEGIQDERIKTYLHAHYYGWKEEDFSLLEDDD